MDPIVQNPHKERATGYKNNKKMQENFFLGNTFPLSNHVFQRINKIFEVNQTIQNVNDVIGMQLSSYLGFNFIVGCPRNDKLPSPYELDAFH